MALAARKLKLSYQDYLEIERQTDTRHEFLDGEVFAMAGGTLRHSATKANLLGQFYVGLRGRAPCRTYDSDTKIRVPATGLATYPDLAIICGQPEVDAEDPNAATNPTLLAEVLSPSTEAWDRGGKFDHYQQLPSLQHYLLLDPRKPLLQHFERQADGSWRLTTHRAGGSLTVLGVTLSVDELYADLPEDPPAAGA